MNPIAKPIYSYYGLQELEMIQYNRKRGDNVKWRKLPPRDCYPQPPFLFSVLHVPYCILIRLNLDMDWGQNFGVGLMKFQELYSVHCTYHCQKMHPILDAKCNKTRAGQWAFATFFPFRYSLIRYFNEAIRYCYSATFQKFAICYSLYAIRYSLLPLNSVIGFI
jgi:hypothetical protein